MFQKHSKFLTYATTLNFSPNNYRVLWCIWCQDKH